MNLFRKKPQPPATGPILHCSFCNKGQHYVKRLIAGPNVYICDECVDICLDILNALPEADGERRAESAEPLSMPSVAANCSICRLPFLLEEGLHVEARGVLCPACVQAVQTALAP